MKKRGLTFSLLLILVSGIIADRDGEPENEAVIPGPSPQAANPRTGERALSPGELLKCDFSLNLGVDQDCGLLQDENSDAFNWIPKSGSTPSSGTGPNTDHTNPNVDPNGRYMYIESSSPRQNGEVARLFTTGFFTEQICLTFYYHMMGATINALNVYKRIGGVNVMPILWSRTGNQGANWNKAEIVIQATAQAYQIAFDAVCGSSYTGDIAIDDIMIKRGPCDEEVNPNEICLYGVVESTETCEDPCNVVNCDNGKTCIKERWDFAENQFAYGPKCIDAQTVCQMQTDAGNNNCGLSSSTRYRYNPSTRQCNAFFYNGCGGNGNNFVTTELCMAACSGVPYKIPAPNCLVQHRNFGPSCGTGFNSQYFYNTAVHQCQQIGTRCVDRNVNRYSTTTQCIQACSGVECSLDRDVGYSGCGVSGGQRWYYNHNTHTCETFNYFGCGGNNNNFVSQTSCQSVCNGVRPELMCQTQTCVTGCTYGYQVDARGCPSCTCKPNPCSAMSCSSGQRCKVSGTGQAATGACYNRNDLCLMPSAPGPCQFYSRAWYYDASVQQCRSMVYGGCGGNNNRFRTQADCTNFCSGIAIRGWSTWGSYSNCPVQCGGGIQTRTRTCLDGVGQCTGSNSMTRACNTQICPGGWNQWQQWTPCSQLCNTGERSRTRTCSAGVNQCTGSSSQTEECNTHSCGGTCTQPADSGNACSGIEPSDRWYYDGETCKSFYYNGCGGNENNFVGEEECQAACGEGTCEELINCDFEDGLCEMMQVSGDQFDWKSQVGSTQSLNTGPTEDHSLGTSTGTYMFIETSSPRKDGDQAWLQTQTFAQTSANVELTFWYHMFGAHINRLEVHLVRNGVPVEPALWSKLGEQGNEWLQATIAITPNNQPFAIRFSGTRGSSYLGDIAIDDIRATHSCEGGGDTTVVVDCTFELECDQLQNTAGDHHDWTRNGPKTPSSATGPSLDHTLKTNEGKFYFYETSSPVGNGERAVLIAENLPNTDQHSDGCLEFYYHMYGVDMGTLIVELQLGSSRSQVWAETGNLGDEWLLAEVDLELSGSSFTIRFVGSRGTSYRSDMAIDDVKVTVGKKCEATVPTDDINCNFDQHMCGWVDDIQDSGQWTRLQGPTPTVTTGPSSDHTTSSGYYMLMNAATLQTNGYARLRSPETTMGGTESEACLTFWYHMYGSSVEKLQVTLEANNVQNAPIWYNGGTQGDAWRLAQVQIRSSDISQASTFRVLIDAYRGTTVYSDIAIDDIKIKAGPCFDTTGCPDLADKAASLSACAVDYVRQITGITGSQLCTQTQAFMQNCVAQNLADCSELVLVFQTTIEEMDPNQKQRIFNQCGEKIFDLPESLKSPLSCNMEDGYCFFSQVSTENANLQLVSGSQSNGPTGGFGGSGWYAGLRSQSFNVQTAELQSIVLNTAQTGETLCMSFYYYITATGQSARIEVTVSSLGGVPVFLNSVSVPVSQPSTSWQEKRISVNLQSVLSGSRPLNYRIYLKVYAGSIAGYIALDSILISPKETCEVEPTDGITCDFESETWTTCGLSDVTDVDTFDWKRRQGSTPSSNTGPSEAHGGSGSYLYIEASPQAQNDKAWLSTRAFTTESNIACVELWYHMFGSGMGTLRIYLQADGSAKQQKQSVIGPQANEWLQLRVSMSDLQASRRYFIIIEAVRGPSFTSDIAIDDVRITFGQACGEQPSGGLPFECPFNLGNDCGFTGQGSQRWLSLSGPTPTSNTGPNSDRTGQINGGYKYIEANGMNTGDQALLVSPNFEVGSISSVCLTIWYHMWGVNIGSLTFSAVRLFSNNQPSPIVLKVYQGNQGSQWQQWSSTINVLGFSRFSVSLLATHAGGTLGDIAVDDITLTGQPCQTGGWNQWSLWTQCSVACGSGTQSRGRTCAGSNCQGPSEETRSCTGSCGGNVIPFACNFDQSLCNFVQATNDQRNWDRRSGATPTVGTGPTRDHSTGSGWYMYFESTQTISGQSAILTSQRFNKPTIQACMTIWFHMFGNNVGSLSIVFTQYLTNGQTIPTTLRTITGNHGNYWQKISLDLNFRPDTNQFSISFRAQSMGAGDDGDIAIDDFALTAEVCEAQSRNMFSCSFEPVGNDQNGCVAYDSNIQPGFLLWTYQKDRTPSGSTGPTGDKTIGNNGHFFFTEATGNKGAKLRFSTLPIEPVNVEIKYCLEFYYHMVGESLGQLTVHVLNKRQYWRDPVSAVGATGENVWKPVRLELRKQDVSFRITFDVLLKTNDNSWSSDIAIDELSLYEGSCDNRRSDIRSAAPAGGAGDNNQKNKDDDDDKTPTGSTTEDSNVTTATP